MPQLGSGSFGTAYRVIEGDLQYCLKISHSIQSLSDIPNVYELLENEFKLFPNATTQILSNAMNHVGKEITFIFSWN
jgi:hypothetical protein